MSKLLHIVTKEKTVKTVRNLIVSFENMQNEAYNDASKKGYYPDKQIFKPTCEWENINKDGNKVLLKYTLEIFENN